VAQESLLYRVDSSLFRGYVGDVASLNTLIHIPSPPAPAGWNQPGFQPDSAWQPADQVYWGAWDASEWHHFPAGSQILGYAINGQPEGINGTTHLIRHLFRFDPPHPGWRIVQVTLEMWSDNKTAWWWNGTLVRDDTQGYIGKINITQYVSQAGGTYLLAVQNSNDFFNVENPQGTAYTVCVTWGFAPANVYYIPRLST
jgi:hypothetical protein